MLPKIVAKLKLGSIKSVVPFGTASTTKPYVVVKPESRDGVRVFRLIVHVVPGQQSALEDYIFNESSTLLKNFKSTDRGGSHFIVRDLNEWTDIIMTNDDGTISMERLFYVPQRAH